MAAKEIVVKKYVVRLSCGERSLGLHRPGQSPVRYRERCTRCLAVMRPAYLWRSAGAARRACFWAMPTRYAEAVPTRRTGASDGLIIRACAAAPAAKTRQARGLVSSFRVRSRWCRSGHQSRLGLAVADVVSDPVGLRVGGGLAAERLVRKRGAARLWGKQECDRSSRERGGGDRQDPGQDRCPTENGRSCRPSGHQRRTRPAPVSVPSKPLDTALLTEESACWTACGSRPQSHAA